MSKKSKLAFVTFLTFVRFPLVLLFFVGAIVYSGQEKGSTWLFFLTFSALVLSALTDLFDGYYARKFKVVTQFGAHVDPLMDKFFYLASLPLLVFVTAKDGQMLHSTLLLILTLFFLARDQWVTFLRSIGAMYNVSGSAHWVGKLRTGISFPLICVMYAHEEMPGGFLPATAIYLFEAFAVVVNVFSLWVYTKNYWPYLRKSASLRPEDAGDNTVHDD